MIKIFDSKEMIDKIGKLEQRHAYEGLTYQEASEKALKSGFSRVTHNKLLNTTEMDFNRIKFCLDDDNKVCDVQIG